MTNCVHPLIVAHRGASADHPENTREAFVGAERQGADWVELDVRLAPDGVLIVNHDPWYHDLRMVWETRSASRPATVPLLEEALQTCATAGASPMGVNVELKGPLPGLEPDPDAYRAELSRLTVEVIRATAADLGRRSPEILISSFDRVVVQEVRALGGPPTALLVLTDFNREELPELAAQGHKALNPIHTMVDEQLMEACRSAGLAVNAWTVDEPDRLVRLTRLGVSGLVTNVPGLARAVVEAELA